jgi:hypothetical protein
MSEKVMRVLLSEKASRVLLSEIKTVRVICQKCKTVVEVPVEKLGAMFKSGECRFCSQSFKDDNLSGLSLLEDLSKCLNLLIGIGGQVQIELVAQPDD